MNCDICREKLIESGIREGFLRLEGLICPRCEPDKLTKSVSYRAKKSPPG